jgi:eukaryotic-like serine/threonine-protein kinase
MNPEQFRRLEALYDAAAGMDAFERARFIEESCVGNEQMRRELLAAFQGVGSGLTGVVEQAAAAVAGESEAHWTDRRMGSYRIVRPLGRGGMGAVFLGVRDDDQFHKEVAIKTLKFELEGGPAVSRFRQERQILAHLEHPNIARLLDGGTTEQGTPFIVLEYVAGVEIVEWCERQHLSIESRLQLFRQVCDAVQYAHQHLIVHRDIKPGNILITPNGVPKLLDFGIAKLLDASALEGLETRAATSALLMTPDYVSPEQVRGDAVSTATDVYSLGAVLYELLTGRRPHSLESYDAVEIARVVCDTDVRPPSALGNRRLRGDLDNIVLKAMHKDPSRRYSSAAEFSEDIRRHLEGLPIAARPDTSVYRAAKFARRHRIGVAATAAVIVSLAIGVAVARREARVAQRRFDQVRELANTFLFQFYDEVTPLAGSTKVRVHCRNGAQIP